MNKIILILTAVLIPEITFCQEYVYVPFPDSGAIWSEIYQPPLDMHGNFPCAIYERFTLNGEDTIINDITYKKLFIFYDSVFNESKAKCIGGIREDENKRIYFKGNTAVHDFKPMNYMYNFEEIILYDFSLRIGDTIRNINCRPDDDQLVVTSIDTIMINNTLRKRINFNPMPWVSWIEGIGSVKGLLFTSGDLPTNGLNGDLICFKQDGKILYFNNNFSECFPLTDSETKRNVYSNIMVYPNPTDNNDIKFSFGKNRVRFLQIIGCNGQLCGDFDIQMQPEFILSTEKYQPGIYFYKAMNVNGIIHTGKFVVR